MYWVIGIVLTILSKTFEKVVESQGKETKWKTKIVFKGREITPEIIEVCS